MRDLKMTMDEEGEFVGIVSTDDLFKLYDIEEANYTLPEDMPGMAKVFTKDIYYPDYVRYLIEKRGVVIQHPGLDEHEDGDIYYEGDDVFVVEDGATLTASYWIKFELMKCCKHFGIPIKDVDVVVKGGVATGSFKLRTDKTFWIPKLIFEDVLLLEIQLTIMRSIVAAIEAD